MRDNQIAGPGRHRLGRAGAPIRRAVDLVKRLARVWLCSATVGFVAVALIALAIALLMDRL